ncbi:MAG: hypothetical protein HYS27_12670 [Deltaproteobacteria bacterium]|nr:hypothetical protein [Deltaproteobacteria bacterium]
MPGRAQPSNTARTLQPGRLLQRLLARGHTLSELEALLRLSPGYLSKVRHRRARPSAQLLALLALLESNATTTAAALRLTGSRAAAPRPRRGGAAPSAPVGGGAALPALLALAPELDRRGVPWAIGGATALEALGIPRETTDVDVFIDDGHRSALNAFRGAGLGIAHFGDEIAAAYPTAGGENDRIDIIFPTLEPAASALLHAERRLLRGVEVPVLPALALAAMKLMSVRAKEHSDALRLIDAGLTTRRAVRAELRRLRRLGAGGDPWTRRRFDAVAALGRLEATR